MKTDKNILVAFILNISFSIFEIIGGLFTNSVAIISDAVHDFGDAFSIGISYFLERKSKNKPDNIYTYGYARYSILGAFITTMVLTIGSCLVIFGGINRLFNPVKINYDGMIVFAIIGVVVNFLAAYFTRDGESINQKSVNLHMLEDVLGWVVVLIGSVLMKFFDISIIDSIMSIGVALFILFNALGNLKEILDLFFEKIPDGVSIEELKEHIMKIDGVLDVHHIHVWSMDGNTNFSTMHVVVSGDVKKVKEKIREEMEEHGIVHTTIEVEDSSDDCCSLECTISSNTTGGHHHKHHH